MADKSPWWRSFVGKRRAAARESAKEAMLAQQQQQQQQQAQASPTQPSSTDPKPVDPQSHLIHATAASTDQESQLAANKRSNSEEELGPTFNETTNRRNLRVSRSGRFKEKKRVRVSLTPGAEQELRDKAKDDAGA